MAIKIEMLRCFTAVARSGNLADAAVKLGRTTSAVSMMLKQFEAELGAPLFESDRKSRLTGLGAFALGEASRELDHFERTVSAISSFARAESGFVRVAAVPSVASAILPLAAEEFTRGFPGVLVDISDMDSISVLRELERERVDLGFATGVTAGPGIIREELCSDEFGVVCRSDHPLASAKLPLEWSLLEPWPFIANTLVSQITDATFQRIFASSHLMVRNTTSLLAMTRAGLGITVLPRLVVNAAEHELAFLPVADSSARRSIEILRRSNSRPSPAAANFEASIRRAASTVASTW